MGRLTASIIASCLAIAAALGLLACGESGDELLPGSTAEEINSNLDQVQRLADEGDCLGADEAAEQVSLQVEGLDGVDAKLKRALTEGTNRLREVVAGCEEESVEEPEEVFEPEEEETVEPEESSKEEEKQEKEEEKSEREAEKEAEEPGDSTLPPQAEGEAKGHEKDESETPSEQGGTEPPPGGLSPSTPAGEG
jgi:hypothetical protein